MNLDEYQEAALETAVYDMDHSVHYPVLGLVSEAGEVASKWKKHLRDGTKLDRAGMAKELGDVLWYLAVLADDLGYDLSVIAEINLEKLRDRQERGVLKGSGDDR